MAPHVFAEIFEVVPSYHSDFEGALAILHQRLRLNPACVNLAKTVRVDAYTSLINVIVWHTWTSRSPYRAARKSEAYTSFIDYTRRLCASRRHVVSHPIISELAVNAPLGKPCSNISPSAFASAEEYVTSQEATSRADRQLFYGGIIPERNSGSTDASSSSGSEEDEALTPPPATLTLEQSSLWGPTGAIPIKAPASTTATARSMQADAFTSTGWLSELAEMESRWRKVRGKDSGGGGWERMEETWALDMLLA